MKKTIAILIFVFTFNASFAASETNSIFNDIEVSEAHQFASNLSLKNAVNVRRFGPLIEVTYSNGDIFVFNCTEQDTRQPVITVSAEGRYQASNMESFIAFLNKTLPAWI